MPSKLPNKDSDLGVWGLIQNDAVRVIHAVEKLDIVLNGNNPPTVKAGTRFFVYSEINGSIPASPATGNPAYPENTPSINYAHHSIIYEDFGDRTFTWGAGDFPAIAPSTSYYLWCKPSENAERGKGEYGVSTEVPTLNNSKGGYYNASGYKCIASFDTDGGSNVGNLQILSQESGGIEPSIFDAFTILKADIDNTPEALTISTNSLIMRQLGNIISNQITENTIIGRPTGQNLDKFNISNFTASSKWAIGNGVDLGNGFDNQKFLVYNNLNSKSGIGIPAADEMRFFCPDTSVLTWGRVATGDGTTYTEGMRLDGKNLNLGVNSGGANMSPNDGCLRIYQAGSSRFLKFDWSGANQPFSTFGESTMIGMMARNGNNGGMGFYGFSSNNTDALWFFALNQTESTGNPIPSTANGIQFIAAKSDGGTGRTALSDNAAIAVFKNNTGSTTRFIVYGNGDIWTNKSVMVGGDRGSGIAGITTITNTIAALPGGGDPGWAGAGLTPPSNYIKIYDGITVGYVPYWV